MRKRLHKGRMQRIKRTKFKMPMKHKHRQIFLEFLIACRSEIS